MTAMHRLLLRLTAGALCASLLLAPRLWTPGSAPLSMARAADTHNDQNNPAKYLWAASFIDLSGKPASLAAYRGEPLVVNFWASWCTPCVREMPALDKMMRAYAKKGVHFVGIAIDSPENVQKFTQKVKVSYPLLVAGYGGGDLMRRLGNALGGLPFTLIIDRQGTIRVTHLGEVQPDQMAKALGGL